MTKKKYGMRIATICLLAVICLSTAACDSGKNAKTVEVKLFDGDSLLKTVEVSPDEEFDLSPAEKPGYRFTGWYSAAEGGNAYTDASGKSGGLSWKEENSTSVYAHWEARKYTITFDYDEATSENTVETMPITYDEFILENFPVPRKTGFTFEGWFTEKQGGKQLTNAQGQFLEGANRYSNSVYPLSEEGTTVYARWGEKKLTLHFEVGDGTAVGDQTFPMGTVIREIPVSKKDNYCFLAWYTDSTFIREVQLPLTVSESLGEYVTLYGKFLPGSVDVLQFNTITSGANRGYEVSYTGSDESIIIPDSYYGKEITRIKKITSDTLKEIRIPQSVKELAADAFAGCTALKTVNVPTAIRNVPDNCFADCRSLTGILLPSELTTIGKGAFAGCSSIKQISIPAKVTTIGAGAFRNMSSLGGFRVDPENLRYMTINEVLYYKVGTSLYLVQYPPAKPGDTYAPNESTIKILESAFSSARITTIEIGGKITTIEKGAFEGCKQLASVFISGSSSAFSIGEHAFLNCSNLKAIIVNLPKAPTLNRTAFDGVSENFAVYVTADMIRKYQTSSVWRDFSEKITDLDLIFGDFVVEEVEGGYYIKQYFGSDQELTIPTVLNAHRIVGISENAFSFSDVETVTVPDSITFIGEGAFKSCKHLKKIILECEPPVLEDNAFRSVNAEFCIYIKNSVEVLDAYRTAEKWNELSELIWSYQ